ncbi:MAG: choice-of-anchor D domain-containing protein, partial [bacterium]|nr:choice-of-anchor D domain-containing protein [bacterium]
MRKKIIIQWPILFFALLFFTFSFIPEAGASHRDAVTMSPSPVNFPDTEVGDTSPVQTVTVTITPNVNVINLEGGMLNNDVDFMITQDNCEDVQLRQSGPQSCTIDVVFSPTRVANFVNSLFVFSNGGHFENLDNLIAQGVAPAVDLDPEDVDFGEQEVGTTTPPVDIQVINVGTGDLIVTNVAITSGASVFAIDSEDCTTGGPVVPNDFCTVSVTFTPDALGAFNGTLSITDNASDSPQTAGLSGTGVSPGEGALSVNPPLLDFGQQELNTSSGPLTLTLTNTGSIQVTNINAMDVSDYSIVAGGTCPAFPFPLDPAASCTFNVVFTPTTTGEINAQLTISSDQVADLMVELEGVGFIPGSAVASLSANNLDFGSVQVNVTAGPQTITVTNTGQEPLTFTSIELGGDGAQVYSMIDGCSGTTVAIGASCVIEVTFTPNSDGTFNATITITSNASNSPQTVTITGMGIGSGVGGSGCALGNGPGTLAGWAWMGILMIGLISGCFV